ncbi:MAG: epoxyqueuosine reductase [Desulfobacterales bacterium]
MTGLKKLDPAGWIEGGIRNFIEQSPENTLQGGFQEKAFENPLVGFSAGDDPIYESYKEYVGSFHWTPLEIFNLTFPGITVAAGELAVISWILPQTRATRADNRQQTTYPSERWARARIFGEEVNVKLRNRVVDLLQKEGHEAVAPMLAPAWERKQSDPYVFSSTWSERHAAYAAGLGTFGLCDGLITPRGKAMRTGSVVARIHIPPTPRPYTNHQAYCLFYSRGICGKCIKRCPVGALSENGHDKVKCLQHLKPATEEYVKANYHFDGYGCGLCQVGVPCESRIPVDDNM